MMIMTPNEKELGEKQRLQEYSDHLFENDSPLGKKLLEVIRNAIKEEKEKDSEEIRVIV